MAITFSIDAHAAGEPCRIVYGGLPALRGGSLREKREDFRSRFDWMRTALMHEPRGHHGMFGALLLPSQRPGSEYGLIFMDPVTYLDGCGHGTLCSIAAWTRLTGLPRLPFAIENPDDTATDVLAVEIGEDSCTTILRMPPSVVIEERMAIPGLEGADAGLARCGNTYALVRAESVGIADLTRAEPSRIRGTARRVLDCIRRARGLDLSERLEVALYQPAESADRSYATAILFSETQLDRSPCGTGSSSLVSLLLRRGEIGAGERIRTVGPSGHAFTLEVERGGGKDVYEVHLAGSAYITGIHQWILSGADPLRTGYVFE